MSGDPIPRSRATSTTRRSLSITSAIALRRNSGEYFDELVITSNFELRLTGKCSALCPLGTTADGLRVLQLEAHSALRIEGEGMVAGSAEDVWLFSEPPYLGQVIAGSDGSFVGSLPLRWPSR